MDDFLLVAQTDIVDVKEIRRYLDPEFLTFVGSSFEIANIKNTRTSRSSMNTWSSFQAGSKCEEGHQWKIQF